MKVIAKIDGTIDINMANTLLITPSIGENEGDTSHITMRNGYVLGFGGGRIRTCWLAVKWIWRHAPSAD